MSLVSTRNYYSKKTPEISHVFSPQSQRLDRCRDGARGWERQALRFSRLPWRTRGSASAGKNDVERGDVGNSDVENAEVEKVQLEKVCDGKLAVKKFTVSG